MKSEDEATNGSGSSSPLKLKGLDYVEFYVGNPLQAAYFYRAAYGFTPVARAGLETKVRDRASYLLQNGDIRLVFTTALTADSPIAEYVRTHGDSIKDIAFSVADAEKAFSKAIANGASPVQEPTELTDECGKVVKATIAVYGGIVHSFIERENYTGTFMPGYQPLKPSVPIPQIGLTEIDHVAFNIEQGMLGRWVEFYKQVLDFDEMHQEMVTTEYSAMNSKVVCDSSRRIKFPIVEPVPSKRRSQIDEYLAYHNGAGVQHIALASDNIIQTVRALRANGIEFLHTPGAYYEMLEGRVGSLGEDVLANLHELNILVDRDDWGALMQIFTKPMQDRPTFFMEVIQRQGARGFGGGNIKALFEAVEREQSLRGNV